MIFITSASALLLHSWVCFFFNSPFPFSILGGTSLCCWRSQGCGCRSVQEGYLCSSDARAGWGSMHTHTHTFIINMLTASGLHACTGCAITCELHALQFNPSLRFSGSFSVAIIPVLSSASRQMNKHNGGEKGHFQKTNWCKGHKIFQNLVGFGESLLRVLTH